MVGALDLDNIAALGGVQAAAPGNQGPNTSPLNISALNALNVQIPSGLSLGALSSFLQLGAVNHYAQASPGTSRAATGAVADSGAVDTTGTGSFPANAGVNLQGLLGPAFANVIADLDLQLGAISAVAATTAGSGTPATTCTTLSAPVNCRDYNIANGTLTLSSPTISTLGGVVNGTTATVDAAVATLVGPTGLIATALLPLNAALSILGGNINVAIATNISSAVTTFLNTPLTDGVITINLGTGVITVDLNALLISELGAGNGLGSLDPNTQILSADVLANLVSRVGTVLNTVPAALTTLITNTLRAATLTVAGNVCTIGTGNPCTSGIPLTAAGVNLNINTSLGSIIDNTVLPANASLIVTAAGIPLSVPLASIVGALTAPLNSVLFGGAGVIATVVSTVTTAVATAIGLLSPVIALINTIVSLIGNVQEPGALPGSYREVALRLGVGNVLGASGAATVDLAKVEVGPNEAPLVVPTATSLSPTSGPQAGGQTVTIDGSGFVPGSTSVTIGANTVPDAAVTVAPDGVSLTFVTPAAAAPGPVSVTVTNPAGSSGPLAYEYLATPTAASLTPTSGPVTGGTTVTITGSGFVAGATTVDIGGNVVPAGSVTVNSDTSLTFSTPAHAAGAVPVTVTAPGGTSTPALTFTYVPTAASLTPLDGPTTGGTLVTVTGSGFLPGASSVTIGGITVPTAAVTVNSPTSLTFTTPAHAAGPVDVTVTTNGGTSTPPLTFTYLDAPTTTGLTPTSGPVAGGTAVTVTGTNFVSGASSVTIGGTIVPAGSVTVNSATSLTFNTPAHAAGATNVTVTTNGGTSGPQMFTYLDAPTATSLTPPSGPITGGTVVTVVGSNFVPGATSVSIGGNTVTAANVTVAPGGASLTFSTPAHAAGAVPVTTITNGGTSTPALSFTYLPVPTADSLTPTSGPVNGGTVVTVTGTGFVPGQTEVLIGGINVPAGAVTVNSATELTFTTPPHAAGPVIVRAVTPGGTSTQNLTFTYLPTTASLTPTSGTELGGDEVTITGTGFIQGSTSVTIGGNTVAATDVTVAPDGLSLTFLTPAHAPGLVNVTATTSGGTSTPPLGFTYLPVPTSTGLNPTSGPTVGGTVVTVTGTGFVPGATTVTIDTTTIPAGSVNVVAGGETLTFTTPAHAAGLVDVVVTTNGGSTAPLDFTYLPVPTVTTLTPNSGPVVGGTVVTVAGSGFVPGGTVVFIDGILVTATVLSATSLTFTTPPHPAGPVPVTVTTAGGTSGPLTYTYLPVPLALALFPDSGPAAGGTGVTVLGVGFVSNATTVTIGGISVPAIVVSGGLLTFVTPAHAPGPVDVTVTTNGGTSTPPLTFTYLPVPTADSLDPDSGPIIGGTVVTVTGDDFVTGATQVSIDGILVPATVVSPTELTFVTPAHPAGPVPVAVVTNGGTSTPALTFTYLPVPTAASLTPEFGPIIGGTVVTVTGTGFVTDATSVTIDGTSVPATVLSSTTLTFVTPGHPVGEVPVTVVTNGGESTPPLTFTYLPVPTAGDLDPEYGPIAGGTTVTVSGSGFVADQTTVTIGGTVIPVGDVTVVTDGELTFVTPADDAGEVDVTVTTPGGTTDPLVFTYVAVPTAGSLDPDSGPIAGGTEVTVAGTGFVPDQTTVTIGGIVIPVGDVTVVSPTELTFLTPPTVTPGPVDVTVTTPGGTTDPLVYTYLPIPEAETLSPDSGPVTGGTEVTVVGTGFVPGATTVTIDGIVVTPTAVTPTSVTFITPAHPAGPVDVVVTTNGGTSTPALTFTYLPTATSLSPVSGPIAGGTVVTVVGSGFVQGASSVVIGGNTVAAGDVTVNGAGTSLTFSTPAHPAGPVDVVVNTNGGVSTPPLTFTYLEIPTTSTLDPDSGPVAGGTEVTVVGENFVPGATAVIIGGITVPATVTSATELTFVTPAHAAGPADVVVVTNGGTSTPALVFTYLPVPTTTGIDPASGPVAGGTLVELTGTGFVVGETSVTIGGNVVTAGNVTVAAGGASLTFLTPAHAAGLVDVTATTNGGTSGVQGYTYLPVPTTSGLNPSSGPLPGGGEVTITGTGFVPGTIVYFGELPIPATVSPGGTSLTFVVPAGTQADVPVPVIVQTPGGQSGPPLTYTYDGPAVVVNGAFLNTAAIPVEGNGWPVSTTVDLQPVDGITPIGPVVQVTTTATGELPAGTTFTVNAGTAPGVYTLSAVDAFENTAVDDFEISAAPPAPVAGSLSPDNGPLIGGNTVTINGSGFVTGTEVVIDGVTVTPESVDPEGTSLTFIVPAGVIAGPVEVVVSNVNGDSEPATYTYDSPTVTVNGSFAAGAAIPAEGAGWPAGVQVELEPFGAGDVSVGDAVTVTTTAAGEFPVGTTFVVTSGTAPGEYTLQATELTELTEGPGNTASDVFEIVATPVAPVAAGLDPTSGPLPGGNSVTVTGTGFVTGTTVIFNGVEVIPTSISEDGASLTFVVPPGTVAGPVTVTITNTNGTSAGLTYTYLPPTLVIPVPGGPGQDIPVEGGGWPPNTPVTLTPTDGDGNPVGPPVTVTTDEDGNLPPGTTVRVDLGTPAGNYFVTGTDEFGNRVTVELSITNLPVLTVGFERVILGGTDLQYAYGSLYTPGSTVDFYVESEIVYLGTAVADANGNVQLGFGTSFLELGTHTVTGVERVAAGQLPRQAADTFEVVVPGKSGLPNTGAGPVIPLAIFGLGLLLIGGLFLGLDSNLRRRGGRRFTLAS